MKHNLKKYRENWHHCKICEPWFEGFEKELRLFMADFEAHRHVANEATRGAYYMIREILGEAEQ